MGLLFGGLSMFGLALVSFAMPMKPEGVGVAKFASLPGKAVGILVTDAKEVLAEEGRFGPPDAVVFASGIGSYRWLYVPCPAKTNQAITLSLPVGKTGQEKQFSDICILTKPSLQTLGIPTAYTLVEAEINDGFGSPDSADKCKVTNLRVKEGKGDYHSLHVAKSIAELKKRYESYLRQEDGVIKKTMNRLAGQVLGKRKPTGPREKTEQLFVTWLPDSERLRVEFRTRISDGAFQYGIGVERRSPPGPQSGQRYGTLFGIELGTIYEVSKSGKVEQSRVIAPASFHREIPPPVRAGGVRRSL